MTEQAVLAGWGRTCRALTTCREVDVKALVDTLRGDERLIPRGLGRGYGDCAVAGGNLTIRLKQDQEVIFLDDRAVVSAALSLDELLKASVPRGLFVPVTPGTRYVTVGGAIAADVHGKNHHCDGTFSMHVESMNVLDSFGNHLTLSPQDDLFWMFVGGMGLTGVIVQATIRMLRIETSYVREISRRFSNLDQLMSEMEKADSHSKYSVAWVDTASARHLGRSVLSLGDHAQLHELPRRLQGQPLRYSPGDGVVLPQVAGRFRLTTQLVRTFNEVWYRKPSSSRKVHFSTIPSFFHPLDRVSNWNIVYGKRGFLQYQFVVPDRSAHLIGTVLSVLRHGSVPAFLSVLKRFGEQNQGLLSFPLKGWTLAIDIPAGFPNLGRTLDEIDELVVGAGGRVYLAKDSRLDPRHLVAMYPRLNEFKLTRENLGHAVKYQSNLSRRLGL